MWAELLSIVAAEQVYLSVERPQRVVGEVHRHITQPSPLSRREVVCIAVLEIDAVLSTAAHYDQLMVVDARRVAVAWRGSGGSGGCGCHERIAGSGRGGGWRVGRLWDARPHVRVSVEDVHVVGILPYIPTIHHHLPTVHRGTVQIDRLRPLSRRLLHSPTTRTLVHVQIVVAALGVAKAAEEEQAALVLEHGEVGTSRRPVARLLLAERVAAVRRSGRSGRRLPGEAGWWRGEGSWGRGGSGGGGHWGVGDGLVVLVVVDGVLLVDVIVCRGVGERR